jgi:hypothetical protein
MSSSSLHLGQRPGAPAFRRAAVLWAGAFACLVGVAPSRPQESAQASTVQVISITGSPEPGGPSLHRLRIATIQDETFPEGALIRSPIVHVTADTTFFVTGDGMVMDKLYFADRTGRIVQQVGRKGEGPGEYEEPRFVGETRSAYHVIDHSLRRKTSLDKDDLEVLRTVRLPAASSATPPVFFSDGTLAIRADIWSRDGAGLPFHIVGSDGTITQSFGLRPASFPGRLLVGAMTASGDSAVWVSHLDRYRLELWSREGQLLGLYERPAPWFRSREDAGDKGGERYTQIGGLYEDEKGRLWVLAGERTLAGPGRIQGDLEACGSIIEVLDPKNSQVVAVSVQRGVRDYSTHGPGFFQQITRFSSRNLLLVEVWGSKLVPGSWPSEE